MTTMLYTSTPELNFLQEIMIPIERTDNKMSYSNVRNNDFLDQIHQNLERTHSLSPSHLMKGNLEIAAYIERVTHLKKNGGVKTFCSSCLISSQ
jgi:hypothetical protein